MALLFLELVQQIQPHISPEEAVKLEVSWEVSMIHIASLRNFQHRILPRDMSIPGCTSVILNKCRSPNVLRFLLILTQQGWSPGPPWGLRWFNLNILMEDTQLKQWNWSLKRPTPKMPLEAISIIFSHTLLLYMFLVVKARFYRHLLVRYCWWTTSLQTGWCSR